MSTISFISAFNGQASSTLESSDSLDFKGSHFKDFQVLEPTPGKLVYISMSSEDFDCHLQLIDTTTGTVVTENDDRDAGTFNAQLSFVPEENHTYIIRASRSSNSAESTGRFSLLSTYQPDPRDSLSANAGTANSSLDSSDNFDPSYPDSPYYCEDYLLTDLVDGEEIVVRMEAEFDAFLLIIDTTTGKVVSDNDDVANGTLNAQVKFTPQADHVYVARASSSLELTTGPFTLIAKATQPVNLPILAITATDANKAEGTPAGSSSNATTFSFSITREGDVSASSRVDWRVEASNKEPQSQATANDFELGLYPSGTITFEPGQRTRSITVSIKADSSTEGNESFGVRLTNPIGATIGTEIAFGLIINDDTITSTLSLGNSDPISSKQPIIFKAGRGTLEGSRGRDTFELRSKDVLTRFGADVITNFNSDEGDKIMISQSALAGVKQASLKTVSSRSEFRKSLGTKSTFIFKEKSGELFWNENGSKSGLGKGGLLAILEGNAQLSSSNIDLI